MTKHILMKYRIGLVVAVILSLGLFTVILHQASVKRQDDQTQSTAADITDNFYSYTYDKQLVPDSLAAAGIHKVPPTITYKKLNASSVKFCVTYKSSYITSYHKGQNCQVIKDLNFQIQQPFVKNNDGSYTVCGVKTNYFDAEGPIVPPTINTPNVVDVNNQIFLFSTNSKAFNEKCDELAQADLRVGDRVDVFDIVSSPNIPAPAVSIFLERSY